MAGENDNSKEQMNIEQDKEKDVTPTMWRTFAGFQVGNLSAAEIGSF
jgi:hypothetical protein